MIKKVLTKLNKILSSIPATIIAGAFLLVDLVPHILNLFGIVIKLDFLPFDFAWITVIICGYPLLYLAIWRIIHNPGISKISSALLICIAMIASIIIGDLFAAGEVAWIMAIGEILEDRTTDKAKKGLKKLIALTPTQGRIIENGKEKIISAEQIMKGNIIRILPGETIPVDGIIVKGETSVDQSIMTGESLPVDKTVNDNVYCGTINCYGSIDVCATSVYEDSSLQKLIYMVKEAENKKAPIARIADKAASWFVPIALIIAIITGIITKDVERAVTVLVVFCPCALVLATPTAIMAAIGQATKHGVIIKSGESLEKMGKANIIAFDKTGTLTYGKLEVCDIMSFDSSIDENQLLSIAASAEAKSEHPLGKAIISCAKNKGLNIIESEEFLMTTGKGIYAKIDNKLILCGNEKYLMENNIIVPDEIKEQLKIIQNQGKASILVSISSKCIGLIALSDEIRKDANNTIESLKKIKTDIVLLTGDNSKTAEYFSERLGITHFYAELLPQNKVENIKFLKENGKTVCMIGDGINDAPALKTADVGIAMGGLGSDITTDAADIVLMSDEISKLPYLKKLSNATVRTIKFSISLSMLINIIAVILSVLGILNPTIGALVHNAGSCFVVLIAALLYDRKFE